MPERTLAWYREFDRIRLGIKTPRERWLEAAALGWERTADCPHYGSQPPWQMEPSNYVINSAIHAACNTVVRECRVQDALRFTDVTISAQTSTGPYVLRLDALPGFAEGAVVRLRRCYWSEDSGTTYYPVRAVNLAQQDNYGSNWMNDGPGTPYQIAVEGVLIYLLPAPSVEGTLRLTVGAGVLAPMLDDEGYDGIPEAYDDAINYLSLLELAAMMPGDAEMQKRAASFMPLAAKGMEQLAGWYDNAALDTLEPAATWSTSVTRFARRN